MSISKFKSTIKEIESDRFFYFKEEIMKELIHNKKLGIVSFKIYLPKFIHDNPTLYKEFEAFLNKLGYQLVKYNIGEYIEEDPRLRK